MPQPVLSFFFFFLEGDLGSLQARFSTFDKHASFSGCKINLFKSEAIHIDSFKGTDFCPFDKALLWWGTNTFKILGIYLSLNINSVYELDFIPKLHQVKQALNCWMHMNILGKFTVILSLPLP